MNARLPSIGGRRVIRALEAIGFVVRRAHGSHHILAHKDDPTRARHRRDDYGSEISIELVWR